MHSYATWCGVAGLEKSAPFKRGRSLLHFFPQAPLRPAWFRAMSNETVLSSRVLCYKCGNANPLAAEHCGVCGHRLYIVCPCGTRNLRLNDCCTACGERLRRRRIDPDDPGFNALGGQSIRGGGSSSSPRDLGAALLLFAFVGLLFASVLLLPKFREMEEARKADAEEREQQMQNSLYRHEMPPRGRSW